MFTLLIYELNKIVIMKISDSIGNKTYTLFTLIFLLTIYNCSILNNNKRNSNNLLEFDGVYIYKNASGSTEDKMMSDCLRFYRDSTVLCLFLAEWTLDSVEKWMNKNFAKKYKYPVILKYKLEKNEISFVKEHGRGKYRFFTIYKGIVDKNKLTLKLEPPPSFRFNKDDTIRTYHFIKAK